MAIGILELNSLIVKRANTQSHLSLLRLGMLFLRLLPFGCLLAVFLKNTGSLSELPNQFTQ